MALSESGNHSRALMTESTLEILPPTPTPEFGALMAVTSALAGLRQAADSLPKPEIAPSAGEDATNAQWMQVLADREALWERERRCMQREIASLREEVADLTAMLSAGRKFD